MFAGFAADKSHEITKMGCLIHKRLLDVEQLFVIGPLISFIYKKALAYVKCKSNKSI